MVHGLRKDPEPEFQVRILNSQKLAVASLRVVIALIVPLSGTVFSFQEGGKQEIALICGLNVI